jgi:tripartite-type tricarboxylate transporter receptor subunit TctC
MRPPNRSQPLRASDSPLVKRLAVGCVIAGALLGVFNHRAGAELPDKQIRIIVPVAAGSSIDARARVIAHALGERLKQQPIVESRPGAGGAIGSAYVAKASPDGTTLLFTNDAVVINPHVYRDPGYDALKDLAPITQAYSAAMVLVAAPDFNAASVKEFIAIARAQPDALSYGSSGNGGLPHLAMEVLQRAAGIRLMHVPYKGDAQALTDVIAGRVPVMVSGIPAALPQIKAGKLRALGVTTSQRIAALAEVPTIAEAGVPGYEMAAWTGFFAPAGTPRSIVDSLNRELVASLQSAAVKANLEATGGQIAPSSSSEFAVFVRKEFERYGKLVKGLGLKVD